MLKVGIVHTSARAFCSVPAIVERIDTVCFDLASASYEFFFELLSHVEIDVAIVCIDAQSNRPFETMSLIRTTYPAIMIVGISNGPSASVRQRARESGAWEVLDLPFTKEELEVALLDTRA